MDINIYVISGILVLGFILVAIAVSTVPEAPLDEEHNEDLANLLDNIKRPNNR